MNCTGSPIEVTIEQIGGPGIQFVDGPGITVTEFNACAGCPEVLCKVAVPTATPPESDRRVALIVVSPTPVMRNAGMACVDEGTDCLKLQGLSGIRESRNVRNDLNGGEAGRLLAARKPKGGEGHAEQRRWRFDHEGFS